MKRILRAVLIASMAALAPVVWIGSPAAAHTPNAASSCTGLYVRMSNYPGPGTPNRVTITVDGVVVVDAWFGESYSNVVPWSDDTAHAWSVVVDDVVPDGDATFAGTQPACVAATSTTSAATSTTTSETTTTTSRTTPSSTSTTAVAATTTTTTAASGSTNTRSTGALDDSTTSTTTLGSNTGVASLGPVPPAASPPPAVAQIRSSTVRESDSLPATGADGTEMMVAGAIAMSAGAFLVALTRRRRHT